MIKGDARPHVPETGGKLETDGRYGNSGCAPVAVIA